MFNRFLIVVGLASFAAGLAQTPQKEPPKPTGFAPIAYFNRRCTDCHVKDGGDYRPDMANRYSDKALTDRLVQMTDTMARAPLTNKELAVLQSWIRSVIKKEPYVVWTGVEGRELSFEATTDAKLTANLGAVTKGKQGWTVLLDQKSKADDLVLTVAAGKTATTVKLAEASYSHSKPLGSKVP